MEPPFLFFAGEFFSFLEPFFKVHVSFSPTPDTLGR